MGPVDTPGARTYGPDDPAADAPLTPGEQDAVEASDRIREERRAEQRRSG